MEEILASIRRIIAEDEPAKESPPTEAISPEPLRAAAPPAMPATPPPSRFAPAPATNSSALRDEEIDAKLAELRGMSRHASPASAAPPERSSPSDSSPAPQRPASEERDLLSPATAAAIKAAFNTLAQTTRPRGGRTVEELVSELIRPMLKTWLDDNLPAIVERLVRAEIERVSRARD
jgi:cell pole-organizing protein PopZ